jgi:hypothetical protein
MPTKAEASGAGAAAVAAVSTAGGAQFYAALQQQAQNAVASFFNATIYPIQYPSQGDFNWFYQNSSQIFNQATLDYLSANVSQGSVSPNAVQLSPSAGFPNDYSQILTAIAYVLSTADTLTVNAAKLAAAVQAQAIVSDYVASFGAITPAMIATAQAAVGSFAVTNSVDYVVAYALGYLWSGAQTNKTPPLTYVQMANARNLSTLLPQQPASGGTVITDVSLYLSKTQAANAILALQQNGSYLLRQMLNNTQNPSAANGGIQTVNANTGVVSTNPTLAFQISPSISAISNDLLNTGRTIVIKMTTSSASGNQLNVSVQGSAGFSVGSFLQFNVGGSSSYNMSQAAGTSASASVTMTYAGYSMVPSAPLAYNAATNTGWYSAGDPGSPINQAIQNTGQNVSGFQFVGLPSTFNLGPVSAGGNFGVLNNVLIANYPTISITYTNADFQSFKQAFQQNVSGNVSLFGFISLGSFSESTYSMNYSEGSSNSTFTVTFTGSPAVSSVPVLQQQAYVIAGAVTNPGSGASV